VIRVAVRLPQLLPSATDLGGHGSAGSAEAHHGGIHVRNFRKRRGDDGFTLIELLVVVVIIGVLVAIAVPVYLNYRKGAADKSAQSDVRGAVSAVEQFFTDNGNTYPDSINGVNDGSAGSSSLTLTSTSVTTPKTQIVTLSDKTQLGFVNNGASYLLCGNNTGGSDKWYVYNSANGGSVSAASGTLTLATCV
jgi:type IV pilus assembly protein PilA